MKKALTFLVIVPCGFWLAGVMMLFIGCSRFQYQVQGKFQMEGRTVSPETVALSLAEFGRAEAEAKCIERQGMACYYGGLYGAGMMDTPAGYTWAGVQAAGQATVAVGPAMQQSPSSDNSSLAAIVSGQRETNIYLKALASSQERFQRALVKNKKTIKKGN